MKGLSTFFPDRLSSDRYRDAPAADDPRLDGCADGSLSMSAYPLGHHAA